MDNSLKAALSARRANIMTIREMVIEKRKKAGITQEELAKKTGIPQSRISEFESGNRSMNSNNLDKIFEALEISLQQNNEQMWDFAIECAHILKDKGIKDIEKLSKEEVATLTGKKEILIMEEWNELTLTHAELKYNVDSKRTYNYMRNLIRFHLALLG